MGPITFPAREKEHIENTNITAESSFKCQLSKAVSVTVA
jgi:hypothetical protein